jgi:AcrR family transcriptional regulator
MENPEITPVLASSSTRPKGIKTAEVKRMKREGYSIAAICNKLNVTSATVYNHLAKKRADAGVKRDTKSATAEAVLFEADLFGTVFRLDKAPVSIERIGNRIVIK